MTYQDRLEVARQTLAQAEVDAKARHETFLRYLEDQRQRIEAELQGCRHLEHGVVGHGEQVGRCLCRYTCQGCNQPFVVDSSD